MLLGRASQQRPDRALCVLVISPGIVARGRVRSGWGSLIVVGIAVAVCSVGFGASRRLGPTVLICSPPIGGYPTPGYPGPSLSVPGLDTSPSFATFATVTPQDGVEVEGSQVVGAVQDSCGGPLAHASLGGVVTSDVDMASWGAGRIDVVARGADGAAWHAAAIRASADTTQTIVLGWESLGGAIVGAPTVASAGPDRLRVFARGEDDALWTRAWDGQQWTEWANLGGTLSSEPDAASPGYASRYDVVALGADGRLCHAWFIRAIGPWECFDGGYTSAPTIGVAGGGELASMFVRGSDGALWSRYYRGTGAWSEWFLVGGQLTSAPDAIFVTQDDVRVLMRGTDQRLWRTEGDGTIFRPFLRSDR